MEQTIRVVSIYDSAIDRMAMPSEGIEYAKLRDQVNDTLAFHDGKVPTWFEYRYLTRSQRRWVQKAPDIYERNERAFRLGIVRIEHLATTGRTVIAELKPAGTLSIPGAGRDDALSDEQLDLVPDPFIEDIGGVIYHRSFLAHEPAISYPLPPSLLAGLTGVASRRADGQRTSSGSEGSTKR